MSYPRGYTRSRKQAKKFAKRIKENLRVLQEAKAKDSK
jgi:hypothetical protein